MNLQYLSRNDGSMVATFVKIDADRKEPVEFLLEGDVEKAITAYRMLLEKEPTNPAVTEAHLNDLGYDFFHANRMKLSLNTYKINIILYPDSFQVYDSYAEACEKAGKMDLAILNYAKSLELNPENNRTRHKLQELKTKKKQNTAVNEN